MQHDRALLRQAVRAVSFEQLDALIAEMHHDHLKALLRVAGIRVEPRFTGQPLGRLVGSRLRGLTGKRLLDAMGLVTSPMTAVVLDAVGERSWSEPESPDDLRPALPALVDKYGVEPTRLLLFAGLDPEIVTQLLQDGALSWDAAASDDRGAAADPASVPQDSSPADVAAADRQEAAGEAGDRPQEEQPALFTVLDKLLIRTAVASYSVETGAPTLEEHRALLAEMVALNSSRGATLFHVGFYEALGGPQGLVPTAAMNADRRQWLLFGHISGFIRRDAPDALREAVLQDVEGTERVVADLLMGASLIGPVLDVLLQDHPRLAARMLSARRGQSVPRTSTAKVSARARELLVEDLPGDADALLEVLSAELEVRAAHASGAQRRRLSSARADVLRRRASCLRVRDDFGGAGRLLDDIREVPDEVEGAMLAERALIGAKVRHLRHLLPAAQQDAREGVVARLTPVESMLLDSVAHEPTETRANYCLGVLAVCRGSGHDDAAVRHLTAALDGLQSDPLHREGVLVPAVRFHQAVATLCQLEAGTDEPAAAALRAAIDAGHAPAAQDLERAADALSAFGSRQLVDVLEQSIEADCRSANIVKLIVDHAASGDEQALALADRLAQRGGSFGHSARFDLLLATFRGRVLAESEAGADALDALETLLVEAADAGLDQRWAAALADEEVRTWIGPAEADGIRLGLLQRTGALERAAELARGLFWRAAQGALSGYDAHELLGTLRGLPVDRDEIASCEAVLRSEEAPAHGEAVKRPVTIVFVGGNERQARQDAHVEDAVRPDGITVHWHHGDVWDTRWAPVADRVKSDLAHADALVLGQHLRTNLGRRLRRDAAELGVPRIAFTGTGRQAMELAVRAAAEVVRG